MFRTAEKIKNKLYTYMKRILCPACENYVVFDETLYKPGEPIVLVCNQCTKQFAIRLRKPGVKTAPGGATSGEIRESDEGYGHITVIENAFGYKQELPLAPGDNIIGRYSKGNDIEVPVITGDPSMGRNHCVVNVKRDKQGRLVYTLRDFPSLTGTFIGNKCLGKKEQVILNDGDIVTAGATTFIVNFAKPEEA